jgi:hypothetical protein
MTWGQSMDRTLFMIASLQVVQSALTTSLQGSESLKGVISHPQQDLAVKES